MSVIDLKNLHVHPVSSFYKSHTKVDVLRLDLLHPVISGNKWFKLKGYIDKAIRTDKNTLITFGGAYSNHIIATAAAAKEYGLKSIGIIRGEEPEQLSFTLHEAASRYGMQLVFISREDYKRKQIPSALITSIDTNETIVIPEGGYGPEGVTGAKEILQSIDSKHYTHIISAVGTGTTVAGLIESVTPEQQVIGISVFKNNDSLQSEIEMLFSDKRKNSFRLIHDYHFGGYAKYQDELIDFMNEFYRVTQVPSDFVYTGKLFFAVNDLIEKKYFTAGVKILMIHTGGLQGNSSLPKGTLIF